jgi:hypothetical protein
MSKKTILLVSSILMAATWLVIATLVKDHNIKEHCLTRVAVFTAAALIVAALPD